MRCWFAARWTGFSGHWPVRFMYATHNGSKLSQNLWKRVSVANNYVNYTFVCSLIDTLVFKVWLTVFRSFHLLVRGNFFSLVVNEYFSFFKKLTDMLCVVCVFLFYCLYFYTDRKFWIVGVPLTVVVFFFSLCHQGLEARDLLVMTERWSL